MFKQLRATIDNVIEPRMLKIRHIDKRIRVLHNLLVKEHQEMLKDLNPLPKKEAKK